MKIGHLRGYQKYDVDLALKQLNCFSVHNKTKWIDCDLTPEKEVAGLKELQEKGKISVSKVARDIPQQSLGIIQGQRERKTVPDRREGGKKALSVG